MKFDQDLFENLLYDLKKYFDNQNSTLGSVVPLAMFLCLWGLISLLLFVYLLGFTEQAHILSSYFCLFVGIGIFVIDCLFVRIY